MIKASLAQQTKSHPRSPTPDTYSAFISIPNVQGVSEVIKKILAQISMVQSENSGLVYEILCPDCNAEYIREAGRSKDQKT